MTAPTTQARVTDTVDPVVGRCFVCQHYSDGECYKIFEAVSVHCDCEGPIDGARIQRDFCCKFYTPNSVICDSASNQTSATP